jgi:hypothetical protein
MGFDLFKNDWMNRPVIPDGWGIMFRFEGGVGFGSSQIGNGAAAAAQSVYNETMVSQTPPVFAVTVTGQLGPKYTFSVGDFKGIVGVGYDYNMLVLVNMGTKAYTSDQAQAVAYPSFIYQGWIARLYGTF